MKIEIKEIYKCEYCNKLYQLKHFCEKHEKICKKNPENDRPCFSCVHLSKKDVVVYEYCGDIEHKVNLSCLHCDKKEVFLHTPQNEIKGNALELGGDNLPMPKECDLKKTRLNF